MFEVEVKILEKDGRKEFVILSYEDFIRMQEEIEAYEDLRALRQAKETEKEAPTVSLKQAKEMLGI